MAKAGQQVTEARTTMVVVDCNVLMQGKALTSLPWSELGPGPFEILLLPTVVREIDGLKIKPGRAGKTARAISGDIRTLAGASDMRARLAQAPQVHWRIVRERLSVMHGAGLDLQHADDAIINHALGIRATGKPLVFLTGDTIAFVTARSHGLDAVLLPDHWLRPPEPDEQDKALKAAQAETARLKAVQPQPRLWFADMDGTPVERLDILLPDYPPLAPALIDELMARIEQVAPRKDIAVTTFDIDPEERDWRKIGAAYEAAIEASGGLLPIQQEDVDEYQASHAAWLTSTCKRFESLHDEWRGRRDMPVVQLVVVNEGSRPAEGALFEIEARGVFRIRHPFSGKDISEIEARKAARALMLSLPPAPPRRRSQHDRLMLNRSLFSTPSMPFFDHRPLIPAPRDPDVVYWDQDCHEEGNYLSLTCSNWRHRRAPDSFKIELVVRRNEGQRGALVARINANNMTDPLDITLPVSIAIEQRDTAAIARDLVDEFEGRMTAPIKPFPPFELRLPKGSESPDKDE